MASPLSELAHNLAKEIHKIKCKHGCDNKNASRVELKTVILSAVLNTETLKMI